MAKKKDNTLLYVGLGAASLFIISKAKANSTVNGVGANSDTINKRWFKNNLRKGNFLYKVKGKYTDDFAFDADNKFFKTMDFKPAPPELFSDWYISASNIWGDKNGIINFVFAQSEYYDFKLK